LTEVQVVQFIQANPFVSCCRMLVGSLKNGSVEVICIIQFSDEWRLAKFIQMRP